MTAIVDDLHHMESEIGRITYKVEHQGAALSIFERRSLGRLRDQIDDLLEIDRQKFIASTGGK